MALKTIDQNPKITDTIRFVIETPDIEDCLSSNPYKVDNIRIYFVERDFLGSNYGSYTKRQLDETILNRLKSARDLVCLNPTEQNIFEVTRLQNELESKAKSDIYYYKDAVLVEEVGTPESPAWLSTDTENAYITQIEADDEGNPIYGTFTYDWTPKSKVREGDFFICWTWTPLPAGDSLSSHISFSLWGDGRLVQTLPTHVTPEEKYYTLLERYLPEIYKTRLTDNDITPEVTDKLNKAVADGFTFIEDFANQIIDLYDANVLHESLLLYLANLFNLKLKSDDPTLWRRQIKESMPLFKKKGTLLGLQEAFAQSGMSLDKYTPLWQVISPYTWTQSWVIEKTPVFKLDKAFVEVNDKNFKVWLRRENSTKYEEIPLDSIDFYENDCEYYATWVGDEKSINHIELYSGDILKIQYQYANIPSDKEAIENFIQSLPLADERDEALVQYPPKNWNVRVIEEDDPMFDVVVPVRHPFQDPLIFGQVRTEFPYSENIYNMEEYNGSTRDSYDVCFIDKNFRDPCGSCLSSKYNVDISITELSDDRLREVYDILDEYTPFTSVPHRISFRGEIIDFVTPPVEEIDVLITFNFVQHVIGGGVNPFFNRVMEDGLTNWIVNREDLSEQIVKVSGKTGTVYNSDIAFVSPNVHLQSLGLIVDNHIMEILSPSPNAGNYTLERLNANTAVVATSVTEPLNTEAFTFKLSNIIYQTSNCIIIQENCFYLNDETIDFIALGIKTNWDIENTPDYNGGAWKIYIPSLSVTFNIQSIEGQTIRFTCTSNIPEGTYTYSLLDDKDEEVEVSSKGSISVIRRGRIRVNDPEGRKLTDIVRHGDYMVYDGVEYLVDELRINDDIIVNDYNDGNASGVNVEFLRRLVDKETGFFVYRGLKLLTPVNHEVEFGIQNGLGSPVSNPDQVLDNSKFKENFLIKINEDFYKVSEISGTEITLEGVPQEWGTFLAGGTVVKYSVHQFINNTVEAQFTVFDQLDRREKDPVIREIESTVTSDVAIAALSLPPGSDSGVEESIVQEEVISFEIEYKNGKTAEGEL